MTCTPIQSSRFKFLYENIIGNDEIDFFQNLPFVSGIVRLGMARFRNEDGYLFRSLGTI